VIRAIDVVVPAHDEEAELGRCLHALRAAVARPGLAGIEVRLAVVLDSCSDRSGEIAAAALHGLPGTQIVECAVRSAGAARGVGAAALHRGLPARDLSAVWLAGTDADTRVPPDWLTYQVAVANAGADAVAGVVEVDDWRGQPADVRWAFAAEYGAGVLGGVHTHVHGANLGVRASALARAGGMPAVALAEDHALVDRLAASGAVIARPTSLRVRTSARREGRAAGGFSDRLRTLGRSAEASAGSATRPDQPAERLR
jgi:cellulose synthase/poly-beta-1,6-N-acetylglucosamine synthase-like glycosyltransferase